MTELRNDECDIGLARQHPVSVLITAPRDRAMAIANAIADEDVENMIVPKVQRLSSAQQTALLRLMETQTGGRRRIIATSSTSLFDCVQRGTFLVSLFYRLNVIHIVGDSCGEGVGTPARPIIAA